jgi:hypothetical protein
MKKIFLSHRFTGEDISDLRETLGKITSVLRAEGYDVYCSVEDTAWFKEQKRTNKEIMEHAFTKAKSSSPSFVPPKEARECSWKSVTR